MWRRTLYTEAGEMSAVGMHACNQENCFSSARYAEDLDHVHIDNFRACNAQGGIFPLVNGNHVSVSIPNLSHLG